MISNFFKIAYRNILRHKVYSFINIIGLSAALAVCLLIYLFISHELTYDTQFAYSKQTYRVCANYKFPDRLDELSVSTQPLGPVLKKDFPEVITYTRLTPYANKLVVKSGEKKFFEKNIFYADTNFFEVFDFPLLKGDPKTVLMQPSCVVISEEMERKYFNGESAIDKILEFDNQDGTFEKYKVTGVAKEIPTNTHLQFGALISIPTSLKNNVGYQKSWFNDGLYTYVVLRNDANVQQFDTKIRDLVKKYASNSDAGIQAEVTYHVQPLTDIHLKSKRLFDFAVNSDSKYVIIFSIVAIFLIVIACINYMNLATARSVMRMKEIGIRKVSGAYRRQLIWQLFAETALIVFLSLIFSFVLAELFLSAFNQLTGILFETKQLMSFKILVVSALIFFIVVLLAGSYPAFYLTSFDPVNVLKGKLVSGKNSLSLRRVLVGIQFIISIGLISATAVVFMQLQYMRNKDLGFSKENILAVQLQDTVVTSKYLAIKSDLEELNEVEMVSFSATVPGDVQDRKITRVQGKNPSELVEAPLQPIHVDYDFFELMNIKIDKGRLFDKTNTSDFKKAFVVNQSLAKFVGWNESIGKRIVWGFNPRTERDGKVVGVVKNIYTNSLKEEVEPMVFILAKKPFLQNYVLIRFKEGKASSGATAVENIIKQYDAQHPFQAVFISDNINKLYETEERVVKLFAYFSVFTILIASLGLLGLSSFTTQQRTKEIGIRKVLGANSVQIIQMLSKEFVLLLVISNIIAIPATWWFMTEWLQSFAYHLKLNFTPFIYSGLFVFIICITTVVILAYRASLLDPVKSIKYE